MGVDMPRPLLLLLTAAVQGMALVSAPLPCTANLSLTKAFIYMAVLNLVLWFVYIVAIYPNFITPLRHLPTPKGANPIFGHVRSQFTSPRGEDYRRFIQEIPNDGIIRLKGVFNSDTILLTNFKGLAEVLVTRPYDFPKPEPNREALRLTIGDGLVTTEGAQHKQQRKHSLPSFGFRQIKGLYPLYWEKAVKMTRCIGAEVFGKVSSKGDTEKSDKQTGITDIEYWAPKATLDIIGVAGLGRDFNTLENSDDKIVHLYERLLTPTTEMQVLIGLYVLFGGLVANILYPTAARRLAKTTAELRSLSEQFVREKRERLEKSEADGIESVDTLAHLMKTGVFSDQELVDQLLTIIAAGHETTSSAFTWAIYLLSTHQDIQTRLQEELYASLPPEYLQRTSPNSPKSTPSDPNSVDLATLLESLPLLNGVCNETLRVYPTVPVTVRKAERTTTLLSGSVTIPANTRIFISPWATNKSVEIWGADAEEFKPERWIDPATNKPKLTGGADSNYAFLTFLHGPRSCIGQNFARSELRCLVAAFVAAFEFELAMPEEEIVPAGMVTTKPRDGLRVRIRRVQRD
ncbi:Cytochrome P450 monooxygenase PC-21 [Exophiala dermatitidis]|uniref:Cytochrome P450 monooxygenase n=1 Tax=Exophiala dermatitidis (strain ATCC 34100 / CBS 525.76 / NIH/UT8656) TaxID=858893 RepID=H6BRE6_EXODN|nr:cytochrome P450 monooxygenase [Exophiala dermatitidis NIH/UT8656]EHY54727.1 cytochrome P450 monooxygenase [Exophiala dermatitidis NIH/UT8656]